MFDQSRVYSGCHKTTTTIEEVRLTVDVLGVETAYAQMDSGVHE